MSGVTASLPGFWRFAWLFFMQPITLHRLLRSLGIDPEGPGWKFFRRPLSAHEKWWLTRSAQTLLLFTPGAALAVAGIALALGQPVDLPNLAVGVGLGVAFCMGLSVAFRVVSGVVLSMSVGVILGVALGVPFGVAWSVAGGTALGVAFLASSVGLGVVPSAFFGVAFGVAYVVSLGVAFGVVLGVAFGVVLGVTFGVSAGLAFFAAYFRLPVLLFEAILQTAARYWNAISGRSCLHWAPVLYHELSYLPHPFLKSHLLAEADTDPLLTRRVLEACSIAPGQRRTGRKVETRLRARELKRQALAKDFQAMAELRGEWLPGVQGADGVLLGFSEAGRYLAAAEAAFSAHHKLKHLDGFANQWNAIGNQLRSRRDVFTQPFEEPLRALHELGQAMRAEAEKSAVGLISSPFRAGDPLSSEEGPELFRGREAAVREIEEILADPTHSASLLLLAPRRSGKTSLLKMLPRLLPDTVCVFFDLQAHPVESVASFWQKLAEQALIQAKRERRIDLPGLPAGPAMEAAAAWLEQLDRLPGGRRVLLAIDEFERFETLFPGSRREFLQLMGLFRATIQHRRGVRLLVSGSAPFDELDRVWEDHFISARQIRLPFLDAPTSVGLLTQPSPDFPSNAIPEEAAREVYRRTGGQPFLLQVYGSLLVSRLNDEKRKEATLADVQAVEARAIEWADPYFRETYKYAPEAAREALARRAEGEAVGLAPATRRWLAQRYLLTPDDRLAIPVFASWIEHHALV